MSGSFNQPSCSFWGSLTWCSHFRVCVCVRAYVCVCVHACHVCMNGLTCRCFDLWASDSRHIWFNYLHPPVDLEAQVCKAWPLHPSFMAASECACVCVCVFAGVRMCVHTYKVRDRMRTFNWNLFYVWSRFIVVRKYSVSNFVGYFHPKMCRILRLLPDTTVFLLYLAALCTKENITFQHPFGFPRITHHRSLRMRVFIFFGHLPWHLCALIYFKW